MKIFSVLSNNSPFNQKNQKIFFIADEFSFAAFLAQAFWFLYYKIWKAFVVILFIDLIISLLYVGNFISTSSLVLLIIAKSLFIGSTARSWQIFYLKKNNYTLSSVIACENVDQAKLNFYQDCI